MEFFRKTLDPVFALAAIAVLDIFLFLLLGFADQTLHPRALSAAGALLVAVGFGLLLLGGARHRAFAVRSAGFVGIFRAGGLVALACGAFAVYSALAPALASA